MMNDTPGATAKWPPHPSVMLAAHQWRAVIRILLQRDTRESRNLAERITLLIDRDADEIARRAPRASLWTPLLEGNRVTVIAPDHPWAGSSGTATDQNIDGLLSIALEEGKVTIFAWPHQCSTKEVE